MAKIVVTEFVTLDGVAEDPGGAEGFDRGGWAFRFNRGADGDQFKSDELGASDALLLGRRTYEGFAEAWPSRSGEYADKFNSMRKYVVTTTLREPAWTNSIVVDGDLGEAVEKLRHEHEGDVAVHGSIQLAQGLVARDLVDELRLMVFPVVLGGGRRLFEQTGAEKTWQLVDSKSVGDGVQILVYRPA